jgi:uncharacterized protein
VAISYLSPGVYIEEVPSGPKPIAAAPTSVLAIVGTTQKGPHREPRRISGWAEYQRMFGESMPGSFTAEAVYGFFANGGPAVYVVRVDPSTRATWEVRDSNDDLVFTVEARSPGGWANTLRVTAAPDTSGGSGQAYFSKVAEAGDVTVPSAGISTVAVESSTGVQTGDRVRFETRAGSREAVVEQVRQGEIDVDLDGADFALPAGEAIVYCFADAADTDVRLASVKGIREGDVLLATLPDLTRVDTVVDAVTPVGAGATFGVGALASAIPGGAFAQRTARLKGTINVAGPNVPLGNVSWDASPTPTSSEIQANHWMVAPDGAVGTWHGGHNRFEFDAEVPTGEFEADVLLVVEAFTEAVTLAGPTRDALAQRYSFLPDGTTLRLINGGGHLDLDRDTDPTGDGWAGAVDPTTETWDSVEFRLPADAADGVVVRGVEAPRVDDYVDFGGANQLRVTAVSNPSGNIYVLEFDDNVDISAAAGPFPLRAFQRTTFAPKRFVLNVSRDGAVLETYPSLALHPDHPRYYFRDALINDGSELIRVTERAAGAISDDVMPSFAVAGPAASNFAATSTHLKAGFTDLEKVTEPAMLICPDAATFDDALTQADVIDAMIRHGATFRRSVIVDAPDEDDDQALKDWRESTVNHEQAAVYAPWLKIANLRDEAARFVEVPPSGFVAGVFARTDRERGVHKAPANERVQGIVGLARTYTQRQQDLLNPAAVNLIRAFPGRGNRIWGARNATDDVTWRYVNVRRLFNMIETSVERETQWVVFEPNVSSTWLRVRTSIENFLDQLWRAGAFAGATPEQAYRVRVGIGETMTETDVDLGLIITEVAIAPAKPAEFVVFRFSHKRLSE